MSIPNNPLVTGWLDPIGKFYSCSSYEHIGTAYKLKKEYHYTDIEENSRYLPADDLLLRNGWVHIGRSVAILGKCPKWRISWHPRCHLTAVQKQFLKPYFEQDNVESLSKCHWEEEQ